MILYIHNKRKEVIKMKVNWGEKKARGSYIFDLKVGSTFFAKRKGINEIGLYMVIDKNSGVFLDSYRNNIMAVNLSTGQIRAFPGNQKVEPINAEVILPK